MRRFQETGDYRLPFAVLLYVCFIDTYILHFYVLACWLLVPYNIHMSSESFSKVCQGGEHICTACIVDFGTQKEDETTRCKIDTEIGSQSAHVHIEQTAIWYDTLCIGIIKEDSG